MANHSKIHSTGRYTAPSRGKRIRNSALAVGAVVVSSALTMGVDAGASPAKPPVFSGATFYGCVDASLNQIVGVESMPFTPQFCTGQPGLVLTQITGPQGFQGAQGNQGTQGVQGSRGAQGNQGSNGPQGAVGSQGSIGAQGSTGSQGAMGNQGNQGPRGVQGNQGITGTQGSQGARGPQGVQGSQGTIGFQGFQGFQGAQGAIGAQGAAGTQGSQGTAGAQGAAGPQGAQGLQGSGFSFASDAALVLTVTCTLGTPPLTLSTFTPFLAKPDGTVIEGTPFSPLGGTQVLAVPAPEHGTYQIGMEISSGPAFVETLSCVVGGTSPIPITLVAPVTGTTNLVDASQVAVPYVYGGPGIP